MVTNYLGEVLTVPSATVTAPEAPTNANTEDPEANYEICDRTGFRVPAGTLKKEWNGLMVRPESWESRHPQDLIRGRPERDGGSPRPEQADRFIEDLYPNGVQSSDL